MRETPSRRLVDLEPCGDGVDAGSVRMTPGAAPLDGWAELLPEDEAAMSLKRSWFESECGQVVEVDRLGLQSRGKLSQKGKYSEQ